MPAEGSNPAIGKVGQIERVKEVRVETLCMGQDVMRAAVKALLKYVDRFVCTFLCLLHVPRLSMLGGRGQLTREIESAHPYEQAAYEVYRLEDI